MNFLPSMLLATTLIGGSCNIRAVPFNNPDISALLNSCNENYANCQVIVGTCSDLENIFDCFRPSLPDTETPENGTETPDTELPDNEAGIPEVELPDNDAEVPDIKPEVPENDSSDAGQEAMKSYVEQVVELVNMERAKVGLPALTMSQDLNNAAQIRAVETVQSFSHTRPDGSSFSSVLKENGISFRGAGENIAWGQRTPEAVVNAWMNSEGHRANILNKNFTSIGVGYYLNGSTPYWAQLFTY